MSSFTDPLEIAPAPAFGMWATTRDLGVWVGEVGTGFYLLIPAGTLTDLGSQPRVVWWLLPPHDPRFAAAYVTHDDLCRRKGFPRFLADAILYDLLRVLSLKHGVALWRRLAVYAGVRTYAAWKWVRRHG